MVDLVWILVGVIGLWAGSELALRATLEVAEGRGFSQGFLGVTVLAIGTDLPEVLVAVTGGLHQLRGEPASGVIVGNAVGSALTQGSFVLGIAGLFGHLHLSRRTLRRDGRVLLLAIGLLFLLALGAGVSRAEGIVLLAAYGLYTWRVSRDEVGRDEAPTRPWRELRRALLTIGVGMAVVLGAAELVVEHALALADSAGWNQTVVGLFLVGLGTSLPELALSLGAVIKGRAALALGNVIGSNVFDLLVPIGLSAVMHPLAVERMTLLADLPVLAALSALALYFFTRRRGIQRGEALALIGGYVVYAVTRVALVD